MTDAPTTILGESVPQPAGKSEQPKFRFKSAESAKGIIDQSNNKFLHQREMDRLVWDAYDRIPPNDPEIMRKNGEEWCTNVDWGETENAINERVEQDNNLITQPMPYVSFVTQGNADVNTLKALSTAAQEHYNMFRLSDFWTSEAIDMATERTAVGLGIFHHHIPYSWHFRSIPRCNLIYPLQSKLKPDEWPWVAVRSDLDITDLIDLMDNTEASTKLGWDVSAIKEVIGKLQWLPDGIKAMDWQRNPEAFVNALRTDSITIAARNDQKIRVYHMYVREYDGKISENIIPDGPVCTKFLFQKRYDEYDRMSDFISIFPLTVAKFLEKIRGLGHRLLPYTAMINDTRNRAIDAAILTGSLMLKDTAGANGMRDMTQLELGGRVTFIPEDMVMDQKSLGNPTQGLLGVMDMIRDLREVNNSAFGGTDHGARRPEATATEMKLRYGEATRNMGYETDRLYDQLTAFFRANWKRVIYYLENDDAPSAIRGAKEAKEMWKQVKEKGVTKDDLKVIRSVEANRLFGDGDPNQIFLAIQDLQGPISRMPITAQVEMDKMAVAARTRRPYMVDALYGRSDVQADRVLAEQNWRISMENTAFDASDLPVPIQDDDNHALHVLEHTNYAEGVVADYDNQVMPPPETLKRLIKAQDHVSLHMPYLQRDRSREALYADSAKRWQGIQNKMVQMQQNIQDAQEAERRAAMEQMRNPAPTVEEQQKILTAQLQRDQLAQDFELSQQIKMEQAKQDLLIKRETARLDQQQKFIQSATPVTKSQ